VLIGHVDQDPILPKQIIHRFYTVSTM